MTTRSRLEGVPVAGGRLQYLVQGQKFEVPKHFTLHRVVGAGAYGTVCAATDTRIVPKRTRSDNSSTSSAAAADHAQQSLSSSVAIKRIGKLFDDATDCKRVLRELKVLSFVRHSNLLRLREYIRPLHRDTFDEVYLVTDLYESDLGRIIKSKQPLTEEHFQYFLVQVLRGLHHLHTANIIHRDMKPSNILINENCDIAICDFGLARGESTGELTQYVVTRWYRPPELLSLATHYSTAVDMWSVGLIFSELLLGRPLLQGRDYVGQLTLVVGLLGTPTEEDMGCLSDGARRFIANMPHKPKQDLQTLFPNASSQALDLLTSLLQFHPSKRLTTKQCLEHPYLEKFRNPAEEADAPRVFEFTHDHVDSLEDLRKLIWDEVVANSDEAIEFAATTASLEAATNAITL